MSNMQFLVLFLCYHLLLILPLCSRSVVNPFFFSHNFLITADPQCLVIATDTAGEMDETRYCLPATGFFVK